MGGGGGDKTTRYELFKAAELNKTEKKEKKENIEKQRRARIGRKCKFMKHIRSEMSFEHFTRKKGDIKSIDTKERPNVNALALGKTFINQGKEGFVTKKKKRKDIKENNEQPPASGDIQIEDTDLGRNKKTRVRQF